MWWRRGLKSILIMCCVMTSLLSVACQDEDEMGYVLLEQQLAAADLNTSSAYIHNYPLPAGKGHLRVLAIGNSYTVDALWYVQQILEDVGLDKTTYSVYHLAHSAASLEHWWEEAEQEKNLEMTFCAGQHMAVEKGTLKELLALGWDVITFQQYSVFSIDYSTFNPWLRHLIDFSRQYCPNKEVTFAWQMAWSYNDIVVPSMSNYVRWLRIGLATQQMIISDGIDLIIPAGTAIQNGRNTSLNDDSQLTCDGTHLDRGVGRYIAACTWVQTLFAPVYGFSVYGNGAMPRMEEGPSDTYPSQPVTESNRTLCQQCAVDAVLSPFKVNKAY